MRTAQGLYEGLDLNRPVWFYGNTGIFYRTLLIIHSETSLDFWDLVEKDVFFPVGDEEGVKGAVALGPGPLLELK